MASADCLSLSFHPRILFSIATSYGGNRNDNDQIHPSHGSHRSHGGKRVSIDWYLRCVVVVVVVVVVVAEPTQLIK